MEKQGKSKAKGNYYEFIRQTAQKNFSKVKQIYDGEFEQRKIFCRNKLDDNTTYSKCMEMLDRRWARILGQVDKEYNQITADFDGCLNANQKEQHQECLDGILKRINALGDIPQSH